MNIKPMCVTCYCLQHKQLSGEWVFSIWGKPELPKNDENDYFTANGRCWQETGIEGVYSLQRAKDGLKIALHNMAEQFVKGKIKNMHDMRIVKIVVNMNVEPIDL